MNDNTVSVEASGNIINELQQLALRVPEYRHHSSSVDMLPFREGGEGVDVFLLPFCSSVAVCVIHTERVATGLTCVNLPQ